MSVCCISGCTKAVRARGLCSAHYTRLLDGKDLSAPVRKVVRSASDADRLKAHVSVREDTGCWDWTASKTPLGYGQVRYKGTRELAHRASWMVFRGEIPKDASTYGTQNVLHRCDNPSCINPDHLFLGDQSDNANDAVSKNRWGKRGLKGEAHGRAVVTYDMVREIRSMESLLSARQLGERFGLSKGAVLHILKRRTWKDI